MFKKKSSSMGFNEYSFGPISPDAHMNYLIYKIMEAPHAALISGNLKDGLISHFLAVDQLEALATARGHLLKDDPGYYPLVAEFENKKRAEMKDDVTFRAVVANYRFGLLYARIMKLVSQDADIDA